MGLLDSRTLSLRFCKGSRSRGGVVSCYPSSSHEIQRDFLEIENNAVTSRHRLKHAHHSSTCPRRRPPNDRRLCGQTPPEALAHADIIHVGTASLQIDPPCRARDYLWTMIVILSFDFRGFPPFATMMLRTLPPRPPLF